MGTTASPTTPVTAFSASPITGAPPSTAPSAAADLAADTPAAISPSSLDSDLMMLLSNQSSDAMNKY